MTTTATRRIDPASAPKPTASDVADFNERLAPRITRLRGPEGERPESGRSSSHGDDRATPDDVKRVADNLISRGGVAVVLDTINEDSGELSPCEYKTRVPAMRALLPIVAELIGTAQAIEGDGEAFVAEIRRQLVSGEDAPILTATSRFVGACFRVDDPDWWLDSLSPASAIEALEVALGMVPLSQLRASFEALGVKVTSLASGLTR